MKNSNSGIKMWKKCVGVSAILVAMLFTGYVQSGYAETRYFVEDAGQELRIADYPAMKSYMGQNKVDFVNNMLRSLAENAVRLNYKIKQIVIDGPNTANLTGIKSIGFAIGNAIRNQDLYGYKNPFANNITGITIEKSSTLQDKEIFAWQDMAIACGIDLKVDDTAIGRKLEDRRTVIIKTLREKAAAKEVATREAEARKIADREAAAREAAAAAAKAQEKQRKAIAAARKDPEVIKGATILVEMMRDTTPSPTMMRTSPIDISSGSDMDVEICV